MIKRFLNSSSLVSAMVMAPLAVSAQSSRGVPPILTLPGGTRSMALSNSFVAGDGAEVVFYNPAQVGSARGIMASFERVNDHSVLGSFATGTALLGTSLGFGMQYLEFNTRTYHQTVGASNMTANLDVALERKGIRIGAGLKYVQQQTASGRGTVTALDLGAATDVHGVTVGLAITNGNGLDLGRPSAIHLPTRIQFGGQYGKNLSTFLDGNAVASVTVEERGHFVPAGGVEMTYVPVSGYSVVGRFGMHGHSNLLGRHQSIWTAGASFTIDRLTVDYAFAPDESHRIGVRIRP